MIIKKGNTVRFLNAIGGGVVSRVDEKKGLVYVEDADGFEIPTLERDCVVVPKVNVETNFPVKDFKGQAKKQEEEKQPVFIQIEKEEKKVEPAIETPDGEILKAFLAFFPIDIKQLQTTDYECYLVNDSNYYLYYNIVNDESGNLKSVANGMIEPNMQEQIAEVTKNDLSNWERIRVQLLPFKQMKNYTPQNTVDINLRINAVKFYKLHSFTENDYFEEPAMIIDIIREKENVEENAKLTQISTEEIKNAIFQKENTQRPKLVKPKQQAEIIEIDLHINELLDNTAGLSNADMLQYQLDKFHDTLAENKNRKGQKIVFIHGKGEGVLRKEIEKLLKTQYKNYYFQDASFREYGFGATMVVIK